MLAFLREVAVIVLGVAIALWGQVWYEQRQEDERLHAFLEGVREDLVEDTVSFGAMRRTLTRQAHAVDALLENAREGYDPPADSTASWLRESILAPYARKVSATYEAMVAGGDLRLLKDPQLRRAVVAYYEAPIFLTGDWLPYFFMGPYDLYDKALRYALGGPVYGRLMTCPTRDYSDGPPCLGAVELPLLSDVLRHPDVEPGLAGVQSGGNIARILVEDAYVAAGNLLALLEDV